MIIIFDELLSRIKSIRASEKRFYQQIRDIAKIACFDYDNNTETRMFFATLQNKFTFSNYRINSCRK
jgi:hypothetical protein